MSTSKTQNDFWSEIELTLLPGEEVLYETQPDRAGMVKVAAMGFVVFAIFSFGAALFLTPLLYFSHLAAQRHRAFVTNQRVIVTDGLFGYQSRSVPLERISDVQIGCSWIERYVGIRNVTVRDMTGEAVGGAVLKGLQDPKKIQELILVAVRKVNHDQGAPAPSVENAETTVTLLREIRDLLRRDG